MELQMQMELPPPNLAAIHWLSELGMDDSYLAKSLDGIFTSSAESTNTHLQGRPAMECPVASFAVRESHKRPASVVHPQGSATSRHADASLGYERPPKTARTNSWNVSTLQELNDVVVSRPLSRNRASKVAQQQAAYNASLEDLFAAFPHLKDELYKTMVPGASPLQFEMEYSQVLGRQESTTTDLQSVITTVSKDRAQSPLESTLDGQRYIGVPTNQSMKGISESSPPKANQSQDHIMAERRRREKLSQRFIALSAILPGLKKMDKASVLGDAVKYVKQLQERVKALEDQAPKQVSMAVQKSSKDHTNRNKSENASQADIEVRMIDRNVLLHVHCNKQKGVLLQCLAELEKLQLSVVNANILSFSETMLDLTFNGQLEEGCELTAEDIVKAMHTFFNRLK